MTRQADHPAVSVRQTHVLCVCRDPGCRKLLDRCLESKEVCTSAVDALLSATRSPPEAVVLDLDAGRADGREILSAFREAQPAVPIYAIVRPADEPLARNLLGRGLAGYFVFPRDAERLPAVLCGAPEPSAGTERTTGGAPARSDRFFNAACGLADLAYSQPMPLFRDGARLILEALGAPRGCAFRWSDDDKRLDLALTVGGSEALGADDPDPVRSAADRTLRTGEVLRLAAGAPGAPPGGLVCVPVRDQDRTVGVVCLPAKSQDRHIGPEDRKSAEALAGMLGRLYGASQRREEYARLALRDVETGLLKAGPFLAYVDSQIARASDRQSELALILLEPEPSPQARTGESPGRLGAAVKDALAQGCQGGRLDLSRYAVALPTPHHEEPAEMGRALSEAASRRLAGGAQDETLRTAVARFPQDGASARDLVAAAEKRLRPSAGDTG